jgi:hypothetical protein
MDGEGTSQSRTPSPRPGTRPCTPGRIGGRHGKGPFCLRVDTRRTGRAGRWHEQGGRRSSRPLSLAGPGCSNGTSHEVSFSGSYCPCPIWVCMYIYPDRIVGLRSLVDHSGLKILQTLAVPTSRGKEDKKKTGAESVRSKLKRQERALSIGSPALRPLRRASRVPS